MSQALEAVDKPVQGDDIVCLHGVTWADYQRVLEMRGDTAGPRIAYLVGELQIMSPSNPHEAIKSIIGRLAEQWCLHHDIDFTTVGSWTLENKALDSAVEPDECFIIGDVDRERSVPDLALEVVWSHWRTDKVEIYRRLGVQELWIWRNHTINVKVLQGDVYEDVAGSVVLSGIDLGLIASLVLEPTSRAIKAFQRTL